MSDTITPPESMVQTETSEPMPFMFALACYLEIDSLDTNDFLQMIDTMTIDEKTEWRKELEGHGYTLNDQE